MEGLEEQIDMMLMQVGAVAKRTAENTDIFKDVALVIKKTVDGLEEVGFTREEAIEIASRQPVLGPKG